MKANRKFKEDGEAVSAVIGVILMVAITVAIAATVYVYVSGMMGDPGENAPNLAWIKDDSANTLTISSGSSEFKYAASVSDGNLAFTNTTGTYYVNESLALSDSSDYKLDSISAGNVITGFTGTGTEGEYQIVWEPTNKLLGTVTFT